MSIVISDKVRMVMVGPSTTTNLFLYSEEIDNAYWNKQRSSITLNDIVAPDGTTTADKLVEDTTPSHTHYFNRTSTGTTIGSNYTASLYVKAAEREDIQIQIASTFASFNLIAGEITGSNSGSNPTITSVGNGWWRCSVSIVATTTSLGILFILLIGNSSVYSGDGVSGVHVWGAQLVEDIIPKTYVQTVATTATIDESLDTINYVDNGSREISILKGVTITNSMLNITAKAAGVSNTPNRVTKVINTGYSGTKLTFRTYIKPIIYREKVSSAEKLLWESFSITDVVDTTTESTVGFSIGNKNKLRELNFYLILEDGSYYKVSNGVVASAEIDIDINNIATITWEIIALNVEFIIDSTALNLLSYSEEVDHADWNNDSGAIITVNSTIAPDGTLTADTVEDDSTSFYKHVYQGVTPFNVSSKYTASIFVKKDAVGRATRFPCLILMFRGAATELNTVKYDTSTGEYSLDFPDPLGEGGVEDYSTDYWRVWATASTQNASNTEVRHQTYAALGASAIWANNFTALGSVIIWGAQLEESDTLGTYRKTLATQVMPPLTGIPKLLNDKVFIRNKLSTIALAINGVSYALAILKANISLKNSVNLINRVKVGEISAPTGHYVEDRTITNKLSFYLNSDLSNSAQLLTTLLNYTTLAEINTLANVTLSIGGSSNALNVNVAMPTSKITVANPTVGLFNTVELEVHPQESAPGAGDEISLEYNN